MDSVIHVFGIRVEVGLVERGERVPALKYHLDRPEVFVGASDVLRPRAAQPGQDRLCDRYSAPVMNRVVPASIDANNHRIRFGAFSSIVRREYGHRHLIRFFHRLAAEANHDLALGGETT